MTVALVLFLAYAAAMSVAPGRAGCRASPATSRVAAGGPVARVLIVGATGGTGRQLVRQALERGYIVTVLFLGQDAAGARDCLERSRLGDRAAGGAHQR